MNGECRPPDGLALSIMQPWSWLIAAGHKDIENRSWPTRFRGRFLIHAGKRADPDYDDEGGIAWAWPDIAQPDILDFGGIIGEAEIVDCVTASTSPWFQGQYGFVICNARLLPFRPCRGALGFFRPDFSPPPLKPTKPKRQGALFND